MAMMNGQSPVVYPSWDVDGVKYFLKLTFTSYFLLEEEKVRLDELKPMLASGRAPISMVLKLAAAMLGTPTNDGRWKSLGITAKELADTLTGMEDFQRLSAVVRDALKAPQAETAPAQPAELPAVQ